MAKITVCIPTYNYGHFIVAAIESVLAQTFKDFELVISDNASIDETAEFVGRFQQQDDRIHYYRNSTNIGMVANWNRCLSLAGGEYVLLLCADDLLEPRCLAELVALLEQHPQAALAACARGIQVDDRMDSFLAWSDRQCYLPGDEAIRLLLLKGNIVGEPTAVMIRRSLGGRGFDAAYGQLTDMEMWFHLLQQGGFVYTPEILCRYRQHQAQETKRNMRSFRIFSEGRRLYRTYSGSTSGRLTLAEQAFASLRPLLAFLYCWLVAQFSRSNGRINQRPLTSSLTPGKKR